MAGRYPVGEGRNGLIGQAFIDSINSLNAIYNPEPPPDGGLRATYSRTLNDASEQTHAESVLREEITRLNLPETRAISFDSRRHFVSCFCESAKLLSMWRAYASQGGGFCLGFNYPELKGTTCWPSPKTGQSIR
jgi:hypothetical protein